MIDRSALTAIRHDHAGVNGVRDTALLPGNLDGLQACVPDLRIERLPQASHWLMHEEPERLNRLIREFIGA